GVGRGRSCLKEKSPIPSYCPSRRPKSVTSDSQLTRKTVASGSHDFEGPAQGERRGRRVGKLAGMDDRENRTDRPPYRGRLELTYLDPPFNTQQAFEQYDDALEHSVWLTMMRDRLVQIKRLLREDGSVWVHCDDSEQPYLKIMMDEVFGRESFVAAVLWVRRN